MVSSDKAEETWILCNYFCCLAKYRLFLKESMRGCNHLGKNNESRESIVILDPFMILLYFLLTLDSTIFMRAG